MIFFVMCFFWWVFVFLWKCSIINFVICDFLGRIIGFFCFIGSILRFNLFFIFIILFWFKYGYRFFIELFWGNGFWFCKYKSFFKKNVFCVFFIINSLFFCFMVKELNVICFYFLVVVFSIVIVDIREFYVENFLKWFVRFVVFNINLFVFMWIFLFLWGFMSGKYFFIRFLLICRNLGFLSYL